MNDIINGLLLCVDDEQIVLHSLRDQLYKVYGNRYLIEIAESAEEGLEILEELSSNGFIPLIIISDWLMPGMKGDEFLIEAHRRFPYIIKLMLSGQVDEAAVQRTRDQADMYEFIRKPWDVEQLIQSIDKGLERFKSCIEKNAVVSVWNVKND
ncbi:two-component response regulator [Desulforapulum autotrophicum HRM2]|uniref:Two-component response regulator n=1 Tax=Desulforapulum autotrophicum (strain ATCC 43914 / DSM 3382 / VKM B-1955 / HRM2) TaxID=177437 RepID=C0QEH8_DESAH|nr:response regulator [Desulforapulum autotrophicum]ACN15320.1 two-component response regulator [Desulforapulum autotrophicum HRM2]